MDSAPIKLTQAQRDLLDLVADGQVTSNFPTRGATYFRREDTYRRITAQVDRLRKLDLVTVPSRSIGTFGPITVKLTDQGAAARGGA
jgi:hypothetical protein